MVGRFWKQPKSFRQGIISFESIYSSSSQKRWTACRSFFYPKFKKRGEPCGAHLLVFFFIGGLLVGDIAHDRVYGAPKNSAKVVEGDGAEWLVVLEAVYQATADTVLGDKFVGGQPLFFERLEKRFERNHIYLLYVGYFYPNLYLIYWQCSIYRV